MNNEYIIINKSQIEKRIEELENKRDSDECSDPRDYSYLCGKIHELGQVLSQSTPLIPVLEDAFDAAREFDSIDGVVDINIILNMPSHNLSDLQEKTTKEFYISNLKLDI